MRILFIILGSLCVVLAMMGLVVPLLPTTPFLLLASALFYRSSPRLYDKLMNSKYLGRYIRQFREHKALTVHTKVGMLTMLWGLMTWRIIIMHDNLWLCIALGVIAIAVTWHILSFKTLRRRK
ncbi:MAG: YbaN family protein [Rikenellaceae bacterium]